MTQEARSSGSTGWVGSLTCMAGEPVSGPPRKPRAWKIGSKRQVNPTPAAPSCFPVFPSAAPPGITCSTHPHAPPPPRLDDAWFIHTYSGWWRRIRDAVFRARHLPALSEPDTGGEGSRGTPIWGGPGDWEGQRSWRGYRSLLSLTQVGDTGDD